MLGPNSTGKSMKTWMERSTKKSSKTCTNDVSWKPRRWSPKACIIWSNFLCIGVETNSKTAKLKAVPQKKPHNQKFPKTLLL